LNFHLFIIIFFKFYLLNLSTCLTLINAAESVAWKLQARSVLLSGVEY